MEKLKSLVTNNVFWGSVAIALISVLDKYGVFPIGIATAVITVLSILTGAEVAQRVAKAAGKAFGEANK